MSLQTSKYQHNPENKPLEIPLGLRLIPHIFIPIKDLFKKERFQCIQLCVVSRFLYQVQHFHFRLSAICHLPNSFVFYFQHIRLLQRIHYSIEFIRQITYFYHLSNEFDGTFYFHKKNTNEKRIYKFITIFCGVNDCTSSQKRRCGTLYQYFM